MTTASLSSRENSMKSLRSYSAWVLSVVMLATVQCTSVLQPIGSKNLLPNGSFETGINPWFSLITPNWEGFNVTDRHAIHGRQSAHLALRAEPAAEGTKIVGLVQDVNPAKFPRYLSGFYRVDGWTQGTSKQYLQVVVIVFGNPSDRPFSNFQIRYILHGVNEPPLRIANAKYLFLGGSGIQEGRWMRFDLDLHADFRKHWGQVPNGFTKIRVLFEVRYDEKKSGEDHVNADVYYDDLFLGE